jgi:hypothetical protein
MLAGYHGAGNRPAEQKQDSGLRHALNEALRQRPDLIVFGDHDDCDMGPAAHACHTAGFPVLRASGRGVDGIWTYCADLPDEMPVRVLGQTALLGQLRALGVDAEGQSLEVSALCELPRVGPATAAAILADGDPIELLARPDWLPRCRAAERVRAGLTMEIYQEALDRLRIRRVQIQEVTGEHGPAALRALGLSWLADRIEEGERHVE